MSNEWICVQAFCDRLWAEERERKEQISKKDFSDSWLCGYCLGSFFVKFLKIHRLLSLGREQNKTYYIRWVNCQLLVSIDTRSSFLNGFDLFFFLLSTISEEVNWKKTKCLPFEPTFLQSVNVSSESSFQMCILVQAIQKW